MNLRKEWWQEIERLWALESDGLMLKFLLCHPLCVTSSELINLSEPFFFILSKCLFLSGVWLFVTPGTTHGILQAKILEWVAIPFSSGSSWLRDWIWVSLIAGRFFTIWATRATLYSVKWRYIFLPYACVHAESLSCVWLFVTPGTVACQTPLSVGFSRQEYWRRWPLPSLGESS